MGALLICDWLLARPEARVPRVILSSPYFGLAKAPPRWITLLLMELGRLWPRLPLPVPLKSADLCRDPELVRRHAEDPLILKYASTGWFRESTIAARRVLGGASRLTQSFLILYSGADRVASVKTTEHFIELLRAPHQARRIPNAFHEVLNEPPEVRNQLLEWIAEWITRDHVPDDVFG
jgi:alpha-beta hydrolase superfamily lysophospholipase